MKHETVVVTLAVLALLVAVAAWLFPFPPIHRPFQPDPPVPVLASQSSDTPPVQTYPSATVDARSSRGSGSVVDPSAIAQTVGQTPQTLKASLYTPRVTPPTRGSVKPEALTPTERPSHIKEATRTTITTLQPDRDTTLEQSGPPVTLSSQTRPDAPVVTDRREENAGIQRVDVAAQHPEAATNIAAPYVAVYGQLNAIVVMSGPTTIGGRVSITGQRETVTITLAGDDVAIVELFGQLNTVHVPQLLKQRVRVIDHSQHNRIRYH